MKKIKIIFSLIILSLIFSCVTTKEKATKLELAKKINGTYSANMIGNIDPISHHYNFISLLNRKLIRDTLFYKPIFDYKFRIRIVDHKNLELKVFDEKGKLLSTKEYKYKVENKEFILLKNKNFRPKLIPYIAGGIDILKIKLKIDEDNNLDASIYNHQSGGIFLIPMGGSTTRKEEKYKLIEK